MSQTPTPGSIFINGKAQIAEMLQHMTFAEKERLLNHIRLRNSALADELEEQSFSFEDLFRLPEAHLRILLQYVKAPIMGISIRPLTPESQRKILSLAPRDYAEEAYQWMVSPLSNEKRDVKRAQDKVLGLAASMPKR